MSDSGSPKVWGGNCIYTISPSEHPRVQQHNVYMSSLALILFWSSDKQSSIVNYYYERGLEAWMTLLVALEEKIYKIPYIENENGLKKDGNYGVY